MTSLFIKLVAIFALRDSRAWGDKPRVGSDTLATISLIPALCILSLGYACLMMVTRGGWPSAGIGNNTLIGIGLWCTACYWGVQAWAQKLEIEIQKEIRQLASLPIKRWKRLRNFTVVAVLVVLLGVLLGSIAFVGFYRET